ncbi:MAG TPA: RdgB/HAM1 family non-canonical purine NTP pyrophosphatase [Candidatus Poseidoniales archaeon]|jgi:XTP/dITP diphosphohydrolase|nr:MAG: non-canonical purine NTP pyrophosphatase, RdgB/HAM1 family [Euryarchaeota archaeon]HIG34357.1 RdgB/HAM1 family non-canonical purine NTP pyrophosphatase [Candidatus Poseidoniales archaeon]HIL67407.1 RdgB/HAM1 family non-canonical purine NTP pyrophosphatase [Candidatus Poseidoniales archaeon]
MHILFATGNEHKVSEAAAILAPLGHEVEPLLIQGNPPEFIEPQAEGIEEVALSKIEQARELVMGTKLEDSIILVEDSGLFIDALGGFPGPYSSYVESTIGLPGILQLMSAEPERGAEFRTIAVISIEGNTITETGTCRGKISKQLSGDTGFGYDPIFIPEDGDGRTCGEMSSIEKSSISHRGRALKAISELLNSPSK